MLVEELATLAAAGGTAVVQAAGTDAWNGFRQAVALWFGRGDAQREQAELERLDQTAAALQTMDPDQATRARISQVAAWKTRIEMMLENLDDVERGEAAGQLRALLAAYGSQGGVSADGGGVAVRGDLHVRADHGSVAAGRMGDVTMGNPPPPGSRQG
ncbi:hypothetical protein ACI2LF_40515 [Kribbella sp. NPDC020789]|uniref:hypothetical protein n=1 Tax=Streptomyces TaxID=1883 RepID=UPI00193C114C|nr:hypothetical protein [Streptomyces sp. S-9]